MTLVQAERSIEALTRRVAALETSNKILEAKYKMLLEQVSPKCHECGRVATTRTRIFLGSGLVKMAHDVWACEEHVKPAESEVAA